VPFAIASVANEAKNQSAEQPAVEAIAQVLGEKKSNEKSNRHLIFLPDKPAPLADLPKFFKKVGRQRTNEKVRQVIVYRLTRKQWPHGLSDYMQWYYDTYYMKKGAKNYARTLQWRNELTQKIK